MNDTSSSEASVFASASVFATASPRLRRTSRRAREDGDGGGFLRTVFWRLKRARVRLSRIRSWRRFTAEAQMAWVGKSLGSWKPEIEEGRGREDDFDFDSDSDFEEEVDLGSRSRGMGVRSGGVIEAGRLRIRDFSCWRAREKARRRRRVCKVWD